MLTDAEVKVIEDAIQSWREMHCITCGWTQGKTDEYVAISNVLHEAANSPQRRAIQKKLAPEFRRIR